MMHVCLCINYYVAYIFVNHFPLLQEWLNRSLVIIQDKFEPTKLQKKIKNRCNLGTGIMCQQIYR